MSAIHQALFMISAEVSLPPNPAPVLHLKADAITGLIDNDPVGSWIDSSGNGNTPTQPTGANKPRYIAESLNGLPSVYFDGGDFLTLPSAICTGAVTIFVVCRNSAFASFDGRSILSGTSNPLTYTLDRSGTGNFNGGGVASSLVVRNAFWTQSNFTKAAGGTSTVAHRVNQSAAGSGTGGTTTGGFDTIGGPSGGGNGFTGQISEIIAYDVELNAGEIAAREAYLEAKYKASDVRVLWLKADAITGKVDNDSLPLWLDVSGKANHFYNSSFTAPTYKTNAQNSLPGVRFGTGVGMQSVLESGFSLWAMPYTVYAVYNYRSASSAARRAINGRDNNWLIGPYNNIHRAFTGGFSTGLNVVQDQFIIQWVVGEGLDNTNYVNGVEYTSGGSVFPGGFALAAGGSFGEILDGDILEVIVEARADDITQQDAVYDSLVAKYAL